jgi:hypothetical protein
MDVAEAVGELLTGSGRDDPYPLYESSAGTARWRRYRSALFVATGHQVVEEILR